MIRAPSNTHVAALVTALLLASAPSRAHACGFHDPVLQAQVALLWSYEDALHVNGAIWSGQQAGILAMPDPERLRARGQARAALDEQAFRSATRALQAIASAAEAAGRRKDGLGFDIAVVLVEPMLWTRFDENEGSDDAGTGTGVTVRLHADGPRPGDLVIVTDTPAVHAIDDGKVTVARAVELGFLRLYGTPAQQGTLLEAYGAIGDRPLPELE